MRETSQLPVSRRESPTHQQQQRSSSYPPGRGQQHWPDGDDADDMGEDEAAVYVSAKLHARGGAKPEGGRWQHGVQQGAQGSYSDDKEVAGGPAGRLHADAGRGIVGPGSVAESASVCDGASVTDGASEAAGSVTSASEGVGHDEDLAVDAR